MSHNFEGNVEDGGDREVRTPDEIVKTTISDIDAFLQKGRIQSEDERDLLLRKLYTARAISNHPRIVELIEYIEEHYGAK